MPISLGYNPVIYSNGQDSPTFKKKREIVFVREGEVKSLDRCQ